MTVNLHKPSSVSANSGRPVTHRSNRARSPSPLSKNLEFHCFRYLAGLRRGVLGYYSAAIPAPGPGCYSGNRVNSVRQRAPAREMCISDIGGHCFRTPFAGKLRILPGVRFQTVVVETCPRHCCATRSQCRPYLRTPCTGCPVSICKWTTRVLRAVFSR